MAHLAIAYPNISTQDFNWIQKYREQNDSRYYSAVKPHFTFIFPVFDVSQEKFLSEVTTQLNDAKKINFEVKVATVNFDSFGKFYHEFLVPDEGYSDIVKLHDKLYSGSLSKELRLDIDFIPHVGIGNSDDPLISKKRVDELNSSEFSIKGVIDIINVVKYENNSIKNVKNFVLQ